MSTPIGPLLALRGAMLAHLGADAVLATLMGGSVHVYDEPPRGALPVYGLLGPAEIKDDSVDGASRHTHSHALIVLAKPGSARTALDAAARMADLLADAALVLNGHVLVTCRVSALSVARDERSGEARATLTINAVTEAA